MTIENIGYTARFSLKELSVVMAGLRLAAIQHGKNGGSDNPFFDLHKEFVRQTGFNSGDHEDLRIRLDKCK